MRILKRCRRPELNDFPRCIDLIKPGAIDTASLITHKFKLDDISKAMEMVAKDKASVINAVMVD